MNKTEFSNLQEIRDYQIEKAQKVKLIDSELETDLIGIIKIKFDDLFAYTGIHIYNTAKKEILDTKLNRFKPKFTDYFPSVLFLNQTEIYLKSIKDIKYTPDCYIVNSSGQIHPYLFGSACDFGLKIKIPVIGYTKKLLYGDLKVNDQFANIHGVYSQETLIGYAIPRPNSKKFIYISVGNNISLDSALKIMLNMELSVFSELNIELNNFIQSKKKTKET